MCMYGFLCVCMYVCTCLCVYAFVLRGGCGLLTVLAPSCEILREQCMRWSKKLTGN